VVRSKTDSSLFDACMQVELRGDLTEEAWQLWLRLGLPEHCMKEFEVVTTEGFTQEWRDGNEAEVALEGKGGKLFGWAPYVGLCPQLRVRVLAIPGR
jgi:hypothetical protein